MLTIVIPSYNHEEYILDCVKATLSINVKNKKIIVIDDGSTDKTIDVLRLFIEKENIKNIEVVEKINSGLVSSLNLGLEMTTTEFIYLVASDDIPIPDGIVKCLEKMKSTPSSGFCMGGGNNFFENSELETPICNRRHDDFFSLPSETRENEIFINYPSPLLLQATIFRTDSLRKISGWDPTLIWDDFPTFVKLFKIFPELGVDFLFEPRVAVVQYRHHELNCYKNTVKQFLMIKQCVEKLAPEKIKSKATGRALAYYGLISLSRLHFKVLAQLFRSASINSIFYSLPFVFKILISKMVFVK